MVGREVVYANLAGQLEEQSRSIVKAMDKAGVTRLIYHQFEGIYNEAPGRIMGAFSIHIATGPAT
jgi:hypothetical protein